MAKKSLFVALEELNEVQVEAPVATIDGGETEILEAGEAGGELEAQVDTIDEAGADADTLSDISEVLEGTIEEGGADPATARVAEIAVESIYRRLGVQKRAMPSMESFGSRSSRVRATQLAIESIKETLVKWWEAIKAAFLKLWGWMKNTWTALFNASAKLDQRAKALLDRSSKLAGGAPSEANFKDNSLFAKLSIDGKLSAESLSASLVEVNSLVKNVKEVRMGVKSATDGLKQATEKFNTEAIIKSCGGVFKVLETSFKIKVGSEQDKYVQVQETEVLPGNKKLVLTSILFDANTTVDELSSAISSIGVKEAGSEAEAKKDAEIAVAGSAALQQVCKNVLDVLRSFNANKDVEVSIERAVKELESAIDKSSKNADEGDPAKMIKIVMSVSSKLANGYVQYSSLVQKMGIMTSKYSLDFVEKSCASYGKEKKEEPKKEEAAKAE